LKDVVEASSVVKPVLFASPVSRKFATVVVTLQK